MFGPSFGSQSSYNYFPNNGENYNKNAWDSQQVNGASRRGYDDYNRGYDKQRSYGNDGIKVSVDSLLRFDLFFSLCWFVSFFLFIRSNKFVYFDMCFIFGFVICFPSHSNYSQLNMECRVLDWTAEISVIHTQQRQIANRTQHRRHNRRKQHGRASHHNRLSLRKHAFRRH